MWMLIFSVRKRQGLLEVALQQGCETTTMTGFVLSHLVNGVVDGVKASSLGVLGNAELVLAGTGLSGGALLKVGLRVPYAFA